MAIHNASESGQKYVHCEEYVSFGESYGGKKEGVYQSLFQ